jgi:hypothetical protein
VKSSDDEKAVLRALESQLRTEDPRIVAGFLAFNSVTPHFEAEEDRHLTGPGKHQRQNPPWYRLVAREAMIVAIPVLVALAVGTLVWLIAMMGR